MTTRDGDNEDNDDEGYYSIFLKNIFNLLTVYHYF